MTTLTFHIASLTCCSTPAERSSIYTLVTGGRVYRLCVRPHRVEVLDGRGRRLLALQHEYADPEEVPLRQIRRWWEHSQDAAARPFFDTTLGETYGEEEKAADAAPLAADAPAGDPPAHPGPDDHGSPGS